MKNAKKRNIAAFTAIGAAVILLGTALFAGYFPEIAVRSAALLMNETPYSHTSSFHISDTSSNSASVGPDPDPAESTPAESDPVSSSAESSGTVGGTVSEVDLSGGGTIVSGKIRIKSFSSSAIDIDALRNQAVELKTSDTAEPQVLIYHTHTSEAYLDEFTGTYPADFSVRTRDASHSVIHVGDVITRKLNSAGITAIHDTTYHDDPMYRGAYGRSLTTISQYLSEYPSISVTLDIHRDCLQQSDGTRLKPTIMINGQKAAQIMLVSGCDDNGTLGFPDWQKNMCFSIHLQDILTQRYEGLARPIYCWNVRYNEHVTPTSLLVEFGTEANTDEEVAYSAELFADALIELMESYRS